MFNKLKIVFGKSIELINESEVAGFVTPGALIISGGGQSLDDSGNLTFNLQKVDGTWKLY